MFAIRPDQAYCCYSSDQSRPPGEQGQAGASEVHSMATMKTIFLLAVLMLLATGKMPCTRLQIGTCTSAALPWLPELASADPVAARLPKHTCSIPPLYHSAGSTACDKHGRHLLQTPSPRPKGNIIARSTYSKTIGECFGPRMLLTTSRCRRQSLSALF